MSSFTVLLLCIQACLIQNVFSQACLGAYGPAMAPAFASPIQAGANGWTASGLAAPWGLTSGLAYDELAYPGTGLASRGLVFDGLVNSAALGYGAAYGGAGEGNVAVAGELPVAGTTAVAGQVPIMGAVGFGGDVAAAGAVSISGQCACGCGASNGYLY